MEVPNVLLAVIVIVLIISLYYNWSGQSVEVSSAKLAAACPPCPPQETKVNTQYVLTTGGVAGGVSGCDACPPCLN